MTSIKNGSRSETNGWIRINIRGGPYDRGYANGYLVSAEIKDAFRILDFSLMDTYGFSREFFAEVISELYGTKIKNNYPEYYEEMRGIKEGANARGAKISMDDIVMWNCNYSIPYIADYIPNLVVNNEILNKKFGHMFVGDKTSEVNTIDYGMKMDKCTGFIAVGDYTKDGKIVCAHNTFDFFVEAQFCNIVVEVKPTKGHSFIMQSPPGHIASGTDYFVNSNGLICTETTLGGFNVFELNDPICCRIRNVVQYANSLDDCVDMLTKNNGGDYANSWLFGDTKTNTIMRVELGLKYVNVEKKKNGYFVGFNGATDDRIRNIECKNTGFDDIRRHQGARRVRLTQLMKEHKGKIDIDIGQRILADHFDVYLNRVNPSSRTCCSHYEMDNREYMSQADRPKPFQPLGAMDGIVTDTNLAKKMGFSGRWGSSCGAAFFAKDFLKAHPQWDHLEPYMPDRLSQPWTIFTSKRGKQKRSRNNNDKNDKNDNNSTRRKR
jgi:hypothetical protein